MKRKIAFQGELGAFSQVAAGQLAGESFVPVPCQSFEEVFLSVKNGKCHAAAVPIENSLHGSVHENYDLLLKYDLLICKETYVRIVHNLIAAPGVKFHNICRVFSHPVALNQCRNFFEQNPAVEKTTFYDTAGSVKMLMENGLHDAGAIASAAAAEIYGAHILKKSIEDDRENFTRFFLLEKRTSPKTKPRPSAPSRRPSAGGRCKTTVVFTTRNIPGALFRALSAFALRDLNLTKIESRPLRGKPWEYLFYLDFIGNVEDAASKNALNQLAEYADMWRVLGCYPAGQP